ncbi:MAG: ATP-binding cassette domain-containing protein, partial [Catalinimonas sp.]
IQSQSFALDLLKEDFDELNQKPPVVQATAAKIPFEEQICFEGVSYRYDGAEKDALQNVRFTVKKGSKIGVVGSSGAGKSTLIDILTGLLSPSSGHLAVDDQVIDPSNVAGWQRHLGYVPQDIFLTNDTIRRNIAFGKKSEEIDQTQVESAARTAQIHHFIERELPEGYDTTCGERGVRLSGGQRQRIALARALYHQPDVLIFDEATSALDNETERNLVAAIEALPAYFTTFMIAHRLSTVRNCDQIFVFERGVLTASGTYDELLEVSSAFKQMAQQVV